MNSSLCKDALNHDSRWMLVSHLKSNDRSFDDILLPKEPVLTFLCITSLWWRSIFGGCRAKFLCDFHRVNFTNNRTRLNEKFFFPLLSFINLWVFSAHYLLHMFCDVCHQVVSHGTSLVTWSIGIWPCRLSPSHKISKLWSIITKINQ